MNERIKELAEQCYEYNEKEMLNTWFNKEKFAELIVKETITEMCQQLLS